VMDEIHPYTFSTLRLTRAGGQGSVDLIVYDELLSVVAHQHGRQY